MSDSSASTFSPPAVPARSSASVSVLMPCYNAEASVERALRSVVGQSLPPLEVVVVDDASTDRSAECVARFALSSPVPVRLVRLTVNQGAASARNAGWNICQGEYLSFLDADDTWHPQKLERQLALMQANPGLVLSGHGFTVESGEVPFPPLGPVQLRPLGVQELLGRNRLPTPSVMLRRAVPERFEAGRRFGEDYLLWLQIALNGGQIGLLDQPLVRLHKASYGVAGLSVHLWPMELAELSVYLKLRQTRLLGHRRWLAASTWSLLKFLRRAIFVRFGLFLERR